MRLSDGFNWPQPFKNNYIGPLLNSAFCSPPPTSFKSDGKWACKSYIWEKMRWQLWNMFAYVADQTAQAQFGWIRFVFPVTIKGHLKTSVFIVACLVVINHPWMTCTFAMPFLSSTAPLHHGQTKFILAIGKQSDSLWCCFQLQALKRFSLLLLPAASDCFAFL